MTSQRTPLKTFGAAMAALIILIFLGMMTPANAAEFTSRISWGQISTLVDGTQIPTADVRYTIERRIAPDNWTLVADKIPWQTQLVDIGNAPGGSIVEYRMATFYQGLFSEWSTGSKKVDYSPPSGTTFEIIMEFKHTVNMSGMVN